MAEAYDNVHVRIRTTAALCDFVGLILCIVAGVVGTGTAHIICFIAIIPLMFSALLSSVAIFFVQRMRFDGNVFAFLDFLVGCFFTVLLGLLWKELSRNRYHYAGNIVLDTYATVPMIISWLIHWIMTLKQVISSQTIQDLVRSLVYGTTGSSEPSMSICPNCQSNWRRPEKVRHAETTAGEGETNYALLYEGDEEVEENIEDNVVKMVDAAKDGSDLERASLN